MRKISLLILFVLVIITTSACKENDDTVKFIMPDGTPMLASYNVLAEGFESDGVKVEVEVVEASTIATRVALEDTDIAIMPTVLAGKLYSQGSKLKMISNNVFGNLYVAGFGDYNSLTELSGKSIYTTTGTTLSLLEYVLDSLNISYKEGESSTNSISIISKSSASEIIPLLKQANIKGSEAFAVLGEPSLSQAISKTHVENKEDLHIISDLQEEYKMINKQANSYPQACLVAKDELLNKNSKFINSLYTYMSSNLEYLNNNLDKTSDVLAKYDSQLQTMTFTLDIIARCNIGQVKAIEMKDEVINYLKSMINVNVDDGFFYTF